MLFKKKTKVTPGGAERWKVREGLLAALRLLGAAALEAPCYPCSSLDCHLILLGFCKRIKSLLSKPVHSGFLRLSKERITLATSESLEHGR